MLEPTTLPTLKIVFMYSYIPFETVPDESDIQNFDRKCSI